MISKNPSDFHMPIEILPGIYRGVIEDNNDPLKAGRCKIRVYGIHTHIKEDTPIHGVPIDNLPWAEPVLSNHEGSVSWYGHWSIPLKGAWVFVFFENNNILSPRFFGSVPGIPIFSPKGIGGTLEGGFYDPEEKHPEDPCEYSGPSNGIIKLNEPDWHRLARGDESGTYVPFVDDARILNIDTTINQITGPIWDEPEPFWRYGSEYPHNDIQMWHGQVSIEIDSTPDNSRYSLVHWKSLSRFEIWEDGRMILKNRGYHRYDLVEKGDRREWTEFNHLQTILQSKYIRTYENHYIHANKNIHEYADKHIWQTSNEWTWDESFDYHKTTALNWIGEYSTSYNEVIAGGYIKHTAGSTFDDFATNEMTHTADKITNKSNYHTVTAPTILLDGNVIITGNLQIQGTLIIDGTIQTISGGNVLINNNLDVNNSITSLNDDCYNSSGDNIADAMINP